MKPDARHTAAKIAFDELEAKGLVRFRVEPDCDGYQFGDEEEEDMVARRLFAVVVLALVAVLVGCGLPMNAAEAVTEGETWTVRLDAAFTAEERAEVAGCFEAWRVFSGGAVDLRAVESEGDFRLTRGPGPDGDVSAVSTRRREAWIDAAALAPGEPLRGVCLGVVAAVTGLPRHGGNGVLGPWTSEDFTPADLEACRRGGVCS